MAKLLHAVLGPVAGYVAGARVRLRLTAGLSTNTHAESLEVTTTAAFAAGPVGARLGAVASYSTRLRAT